jgi:hypothetical protein
MGNKNTVTSKYHYNLTHYNYNVNKIQIRKDLEYLIKLRNNDFEVYNSLTPKELIRYIYVCRTKDPTADLNAYTPFENLDYVEKAIKRKESVNNSYTLYQGGDLKPPPFNPEYISNTSSSPNILTAPTF